MLVNKTWKRYLESEPRFWLHLDLQCKKKKIPRKILSTVLSRSKRHLKSACLCLETTADLSRLGMILQECAQFRELTVRGYSLHPQFPDIITSAHALETLVLSATEVSWGMMTQILRACSQLKDVVFYERLSPLESYPHREMDFHLPKLNSFAMVTSKNRKISIVSSTRSCIHSNSLVSLRLRHSA
jgi:hypothetical protein